MLMVDEQLALINDKSAKKSGIERRGSDIFYCNECNFYFSNSLEDRAEHNEHHAEYLKKAKLNVNKK